MNVACFDCSILRATSFCLCVHTSVGIVVLAFCKQESLSHRLYNSEVKEKTRRNVTCKSSPFNFCPGDKQLDQ